MTLRTLNYGNYGIFLIMGDAGFCPSAVGLGVSGSGSGDDGLRVIQEQRPKTPKRHSYEQLKPTKP